MYQRLFVLKQFLQYLRLMIPVEKSNIHNILASMTVFTSLKHIRKVLKFLKEHINTQFSLLTAISGVDYLFRESRFEVVYELLSLCFNNRLKVKTQTNELVPIESAVSIHPGATWWEREIWDMFGIFFTLNKKISRLITDYGFEGYPLRKDFPLGGFYELRYSDKAGHIVYERVQFSQKF